MNRVLLPRCVLFVAAASLSGCAQQYFDIELRAGDVVRAGETVGAMPKVCSSEGERVGYAYEARPTTTDERGAPDDPSLSTFRFGPSSPPGLDRTPSPWLASGAAITGAGAVMLVASGTNLFSCPGPTGCEIPGWAGPVALGGLGTLVVGAVVLIIGGVDPDAGTTARPYNITKLGEGHICAP